MIIRENKDAAAYIRAKGAIDPAAFKRLPSEIRAKAFCVAHVHDMDAVRDLIKMVERLPKGADWKKLRREIAAKISPYMGDNVVAARNKAELLLRTHGFQAYAAGRYKAQVERIEAFPYWQYVSVGDSHVRDDHAALDGKVFPADDPFWQDHTPPWDFGCRCYVVAITERRMNMMKEAESDKPPAERKILTGKYLDDARAGRVNRGDGRGYADVRSPQDKLGRDAYSWTPGRVAPTLEELKGRYSADEWKLVEQALKREKIIDADGSEISVFDFLEEGYE